MNKLTLIGHLGNDAVLRSASQGKEDFLSFSVAVSDDYTNKEGVKVEKTVWYDCIFKRTKLAPYLKKGGKIYLEGKPSYSIFETKAGEKQISINVSISSLELLDRKPENAA